MQFLLRLTRSVAVQVTGIGEGEMVNIEFDGGEHVTVGVKPELSVAVGVAQVTVC